MSAKNEKEKSTMKPAKAPKYVYVLRTCGPDLKSKNDFQWPVSGTVKCPDWKPTTECGNGLHGMLWGAGEAGFLNWSADAKWLVVKVEAAKVVDLGGKVKFPAGKVVFCGDRKGATDWIIACGAASAKVLGAFLTGGDRSTLTGDYGSTLTGGDRSTLTGGYGSTLTGGDGSTLQFKYWDHNASRLRIKTCYPGEDGIKINTKYTLNDKREIVEVTK